MVHTKIHLKLPSATAADFFTSKLVYISFLNNSCEESSSVYNAA